MVVRLFDIMFGQHSAESAVCSLGVRYYAVEVGLSLDLVVHVAGFVALRMC